MLHRTHMHACTYMHTYVFTYRSLLAYGCKQIFRRIYVCSPSLTPLTLPLTHPLTLLHSPLFRGEAVLMILQKDHAIKAWREFMGPTNSLTVPKP